MNNYLDSAFKFCRSFASENRTVLTCLLLFFLVWKTFYPCIGNDFVNYDDHDYVYNNEQVKSGLTLKSVFEAFSSSTSANWHPLTMLSHTLDWELFGPNPAGHHLPNVIIHSFNSVLAFLLLHRITGAFWKSFFVALIFGIHPLRVESVAWVSERKDVLSTMFWMLAALAYTKWLAEKAAQNPKARSYYGLALLWLLLGLMSKPMLVTFPCVLLLLDFWPLKRWNKETAFSLVKEKVPFFVLSGIFSALTCFTQKYAMLPTSYLPLWVRIENMPVAYCRYLGNIFYPVDLSIFYPYPLYWPGMRVIASILAILAITALALFLWQRRPHFLIGWLWFLGTLFPVIGLTQAGSQSMADRYSYVPSIGIIIIFVWSVFEMARRWKISFPTLCVAGFGIAITCSALTRVQICHWYNGETLFRHAAAVTKDNYVAHALVGFSDMGRTNFDAAIEHFEEALRVKGDMANVHIGLGVALTQKGRLDEAIRILRDASWMEPTNAQPHKEMAVALLAKGRRDEAFTNLLYALKLRPDYPEATEELRKLTNSAPVFTNDAAPDFHVSTEDDKPLKLSDFRGKYVLLDFGATWYRPSLEETPHLKATYDAFGDDQRFVMLSLSLDLDRQNYKKHLDAWDIRWKHVLLDEKSKGALAHDYGIDSIPKVFLIDPDGKVIARDLRGPKIKETVAGALAKG